MRGEVVLVRAFGGKALKRRVWDVGVGVVYITNDEHFENPVAGRRSVKPIGFPREDVFKDLQNEFLDDGAIDWSKLVPWQIPGSTDENHKKIEAKPKQYPLCFEVTASLEPEASRAIQLHMFLALPTCDRTETRNSKTSDKKNRGHLDSFTKEIPTCESASPKG